LISRLWARSVREHVWNRVSLNLPGGRTARARPAAPELRLEAKEPIVERLVAIGLLIVLAASCSSGSEPVPTTSTTDPASVTEATTQPGPELARIISSLAAAGYPCEHVELASGFVLADGATDEATADCGGENLDIAVFPTAQQAEEYGQQGGAPYAAGDGWVIVTETITLAERIADALGGTTG
jgi:hypothetical protein